MRTSWRSAGILFAGALLVGGLVASCANQSVAGTGGPGTTPSGPGGTIVEVPTSTATADLPPSRCPASATAPGDGLAVPTPTGKPMITITQGTNSWVASDLTQPFAIAVYPDGTAIRTEDQGILSEPLPEMTIGRLDACHLQEAVSQLERLAGTDLGQATVTDQGTTTITLHRENADVVLDVYALGVGDDFVQPDQRAARQLVTGLIDDLTGGMTQTGSWTPDRLRVSAYGTPADVTGGATWPLDGTIAAALDHGGRRPCGVFEGADAAAIRAELGTGRAASSWTDGTQTVVLAVGVLVPGQDCSPS
jgi:hypothetical protein